MKAWDTIINTAMLGTDKTMPPRDELPDGLADVIAMIDTNEGLDKEDRFLQRAAVIGNYRRSGFRPLQKPEIGLPSCEPETQPYCSVHAASLLKNILEEDNAWLLHYWLKQCAAKGQLMLPEILPVLLDKAAKDEELYPLVNICGGKRGEWLSKFNPVWNLFATVAHDDLWLNGKPADRLKVLTNIRLAEPNKALNLVKETWEQENAATKTDLINVIKINTGADDLTWLESLLTEKSIKVKDAVLDLLKSIPGSSIINKYQEVLRQAVVLKKEKGLLGLVNKTSIFLQLPANIDENIFKTGIEKMVGGKSNISDEVYIIHQLIGFVPPTFWEAQFNAALVQVVEYFEKYAPALLPALTQAAIRFKADAWVELLLDQPQFYSGLFLRLNPIKQEQYLMRYFKQDAPEMIRQAVNMETEWQPGFTMTALNFMANNPYQYSKSFFKENIRVINTGVLSKLNDIDTKDANVQNAWERSREQLSTLLSLKQQIQQVFNA